MRRSAGRSGCPVTEPLIGMVRGLFVADTDAEAERLARPAYRKWFDNLMWLWRENNSFPTISLSQDYDELIRDGSLVVGSPDKVRRKLVAQTRRCGQNYLVLKLAFGSLTHAQEMRSLELFRREVMPALTRKLHRLARTRRQRRVSKDMAKLNETHDPARRSFVQSANQPDTDFPIQNLPFGVFRRNGGEPQGGVAIGDRVLDLKAALAAGLFSGAAAEAAQAAAGRTLNPLMALGNAHASALRARLSDLLRADGPERARLEAMGDRLLVPLADVRLEMPAEVASFTDFFTSIFHAERGGRMRNPDQPLTPNFKHIPIGYNGRASSIRVSGGSFTRPNGQYRDKAGELRFGPEPRQDFELEVGAYIARGNPLGTPIPLSAARRPHLRLLPAQRLVGARDPGLGNGSGRTVPGQELLHHDLALGDHRRGAGAVSLPGFRPRRR